MNDHSRIREKMYISWLLFTTNNFEMHISITCIQMGERDISSVLWIESAQQQLLSSSLSNVYFYTYILIMYLSLARACDDICLRTWFFVYSECHTRIYTHTYTNCLP